MLEAKDAFSHSRSQTPMQSRSVTPTPPSEPTSVRLEKFGHLTVRVIEGRNLALPPNEPIPPAIENAVKVEHLRGPTSRESLQPVKRWWLPYLVLEYDKNAILVDAIGGQLSVPMWCSHAHL